LKVLAALLLATEIIAGPEIRYFRYERPVQLPAGSSNRVCLVADASLFTHSSPGLADLRVYRDRNETAYVIETSTPPNTVEQTIALLNLGTRAGQTVFDAAMNASSYNDLRLNIGAHDFIATVRVSGSQQQTGPETKIGSFTIFDLSRQRLGRSTVLHLPDSDYRFLHFRVVGPLMPDAIDGLSIEQRSKSHPAYVTIAESTHFTRQGKNTVAEFLVPAHVPVEQIEFVPGPAPANFSRNVTVAAISVPLARSSDGRAAPQTYTTYNSLLRVHVKQDDHAIDQEQLSIDVPQAFADTPAKWTITVDNGDDAPLVPVSVRLKMRKRDVCFETAAAGGYTLYYGDPALSAPRYDLGQFFNDTAAVRATLGPEQSNPEFQPRPDTRPFTEQHPTLLWLALALVIGVLGFVALRTARATGTTVS
jgi:hypothetical protein